MFPNQAGGGGIEPRRTQPSVLETECVPRRSHHLYHRRRYRFAFRASLASQSRPNAEPSTPCGSRTRPKRLERPPTSPEVERGVSRATFCRTARVSGLGQKSEPAGGRFLPPAGAVAITGSPGVIRSYPVPRFPYQDLHRDRSQAGRRDTAPSQRPSRSCEVRCSRARGSWLYRV